MMRADLFAELMMGQEALGERIEREAGQAGGGGGGKPQPYTRADGVRCTPITDMDGLVNFLRSGPGQLVRGGGGGR